MKRKIWVCMMAAAAAFSLTVPASAVVANRGNAGRFYVDANGDGICDNFTDKNGDGICDYFTDKDGDGICDQYTGQCGRGMRGARGRGLGRGRF